MAVARAFKPTFVIERVVYGTITMMCVLIVYDGWSKIDLVEVIGVMAGPIIAMFLAHVFATLIAKQASVDSTLDARSGWARSVGSRDSCCWPCRQRC